MSKRLRVAVMWMLMLLVPLQGFAASSMLLCAPAHHGAGNRVDSPHVHSAAPAGHRLMDSVDLSAHHTAHHPAGHSAHHAAGHGSNHGPDHAASHADPVDDPGKPGSAKCSVCASFCNTAALPSATLIPPVTAPGSARIPVAPDSHVGYITGGPERPPRPAFA